MKKLLLVGILFSGTVAFGQVLSEDFESVASPNLPAGWTTSNASGGDMFITGNSAAANAGGYWPVPTHGQFAMANDDVCNCVMTDVYLEMPSMNFTGMSGMALSYECVDDGNYGGNPHSVEISIDGGSTWNSIYTHAFNAAIVWESVLVPLTGSDNQSDVRVRFKYDDGGVWATGVAIDDVVVDALPAIEAELTSVDLPRYAATSSNTTLVMNVTNLGANTITSIDADWNDGTAHPATITVNIPSGSTVAVNHPDAVNYAVATEANISVSITAVNGGADADPNNNDGSALHNTVSQIVPKKVVIEEGTGTWCGWCPRGAVAMDYMTTTYPNQFVGIAVHNGDPMTVAAYDNAADFSGFPGCNVDRIWLDQSVSQSAFENYYNQRKDMIVPAGLTVTATGTSSVTIDVDATFYTPMSSANYRLAVVMVEDGVTGTTNAYNQANYYAGGANGPMGGYESLPDPVPAAQMVYDHVGRALVGGYNGQAGSVPGTLVDGQVASYTFNYTVPATSDWQNMHAVALLIDQSTGEIVTAETGDLLTVDELSNINMNVYPNPASETFNIVFEGQNADYNVQVMDLQGRVVMSGEYANLSGKQLITVPVADMAKGSYMVTISTEAGTKTMNVIVD